MLIWWRRETDGAMGVEHGIVRAADVAELTDASALKADAVQRAQAIVAEAQAQAQQILQAAHEQAQAIVADAQQSVEAALESARQEGERQSALEWHERQASHAVKTAHTLRGMHERLADVVTNAVERIVQSENRSALYQRALKSVQSLSRSATALTLRVSPDDAEAAREGLAGVAELQTLGTTVEVQVDASLAPGSCIFESDMGVVDASLSTQLDALRAAMARAVRKAVAE
jgi:type III secretion protein L